jgi:Aerotolerance regulator N-terminal
MTFIFPVLLGGLVLMGIPILLHLIMRQKPKHLLFPAFRFLLQRHRTNQRKIRFRHLLLLALRLMLIIAICLALARPKIFSERLNLGGDRPVAAVLLFDTSYSMQYESGGETRLDAARRRALELLDELPEGSKIAILDSGEPGGEWLPTLSLARDRISTLRLRPANGPVTSRLTEAFRLLADLDQGTEVGEDPLPHFLYLFSDRTQESWEQGRVKDLQQLRDRFGTEVHSVFVDVGTDEPVDLALTAMELPRQVIPPDDKVVLRITVRATGADCDTEVLCHIDGEKTADRKPIKLSAGQSQVLVFERGGLAPGPHQAEIKLANNDALPFNDALFATFEVRGGRKVLTLVDDLGDASYWQWALELPKGFHCEVHRVKDMLGVSPSDLNQRYQAICLLSVAKPSEDLWQKLSSFVAAGGGLAIVPVGEELVKAAYNESKAAQGLLPAQFMKTTKAEQDKGVTWKETTYRHPVMAPFREWAQSQSANLEQLRPAAFRYWEVRPLPEDTYVIVSYDDKEGRPALLERNFDRKKIRGHVLLFTTPLDYSHLYKQQERWNDYLTSWFYMALANETMAYLAGDAEQANYQYLSGQPVTVPLPAAPHSSTCTLKGPGLSATEAIVPRPEKQTELTLTQAVTPGNYTLVGEEGKWISSFSINVPPEESQLARIAPERIEELLGPGSLLSVGHGTSLREALQGRWKQPLELFPWLMILVLFALAVENFLANRFYRREPSEEEHT